MTSPSSAMKKLQKERKVREQARVYGPVGRRKWVKSLPCSVPGCTNRPSDNAHVSPEGDPSGTARKHDYTQIIPLCRKHHDEMDGVLGQRPFNDKYGIDVDLIAIMTEDKWREHEDALAA